MSRKGDLDDNHVRRHGLVTFKAAMERGVHSALSMAWTKRPMQIPERIASRVVMDFYYSFTRATKSKNFFASQMRARMVAMAARVPTRKLRMGFIVHRNYKKIFLSATYFFWKKRNRRPTPFLLPGSSARKRDSSPQSKKHFLGAVWRNPTNITNSTYSTKTLNRFSGEKWNNTVVRCAPKGPAKVTPKC